MRAVASVSSVAVMVMMRAAVICSSEEGENSRLPGQQRHSRSDAMTPTTWASATACGQRPLTAVNGQLHIRCLNIFSRPVVSELGGEAAHGRRGV
ncbi:hypothetical protein Dimus_005505 [Dionaea muscipula]